MKEKKNKYLSYGIYSLCLLFIIYATIYWMLPFISILRRRISMMLSGEELAGTTLIGFTIRNLSIYIGIRVIATISAFLLLIKRTKFSIMFFVAMFAPILLDYLLFFVNNTNDYLKALRFMDFIKMIHLELIYTVLLLLVFGLNLISNSLRRISLKMSLKEGFVWFFVSAAILFLYFKFNLKF